MPDLPEKIVIVGGGFAGVTLAQRLERLLPTQTGFIAWFLWRGIYLAKLPTFSRKLEVAINWACSIPFPPNIVQLEVSKKQPYEAKNERSEAQSIKTKDAHEYQT